MKDIKLFERTLAHLLTYGYKLMTSTYGWLLAVISAVGTFFAPEKLSFLFVAVAILLDALFGIMVSASLGKFMLSKLMRVTFFKFTAYGAALAVWFMIETLAHDSNYIAVKVVAGYALACEFWSMSASILILWPEATFFKILRRYLKGEIAAKLGQQVDDILTDEPPQ